MGARVEADQPNRTVIIAALLALTVASVVAYRWATEPHLMGDSNTGTLFPGGIAENGSADHPYLRSSNVTEYYGDCPPSPTRMHVWHDQAGFMRLGKYAKLTYDEHISVCMFCGAHIV